MATKAIGRTKIVDDRRVYVLNSSACIAGKRDRYSVVGGFGHGGFANVYKVRSMRTGRICILKMSSEVLKNSFGGARIRREALVLKHCNVNGRGRVPELLDFGLADGRPFYIMENLQPLEWSRSETGLPDTDEKRVLFFSLFIECVAAVHEAGFIHCDIKPQNIMQRESDHRPVLIDFGSANPIADGPACCRKKIPGWAEITKVEGRRACTRGYDDGDDDYTIQKDIFAIGQVMRDTFGEVVDLGWTQIINKCISRQPKHRYSSLDELREDVVNVEKIRRRTYWQLRVEKIREQRRVERSLSGLDPELVRRDDILVLDEVRSSRSLKVFKIEFPKGERLHYMVDEPIIMGENTILIVSGKGILEARIVGPSSSAVVLRDYAILHNTSSDLPPENDITYVIVGPGSYLNFPDIRSDDYKKFFPTRRRILRDIDATTSFRFGGPKTFSGIEKESLSAIADSDLPDSYKTVLTKFFKGEAFTVLPHKCKIGV